MNFLTLRLYQLCIRENKVKIYLKWINFREFCHFPKSRKSLEMHENKGIWLKLILSREIKSARNIEKPFICEIEIRAKNPKFDTYPRKLIHLR